VFFNSPSNSRSSIFIFAIILAFVSQFPIAAQVSLPASANEVEVMSLPDFDARQLRARPVRASNIEQKRRARALKDKVILRWNDEMDLPHMLLSTDAPLTPRSSDDPVTIAHRFIRDNSSLFAVSQSELDSARVSARATDERSGFTRLALEQRVNRIRVFDSEMLFILDKDGRVLSESGSFIPQIEHRAPASRPLMTDEQALSRAAKACGAQLTAPLTATKELLPARERVIFSSEEVDGRSETSLVYYPITRDDVRLAFQVLLYGVPDVLDAYLILIDASTGELLRRDSLTRSLDGPHGRVFAKENPALCDREMIPFAGDRTASPQGWVGANRTEGNNARVYFNPSLSGGDTVRANADGNFDFAIDLAPGHSPLDSGEASAANLFYWVNWAHDRFYALGFNELSRNFQADNFGKGGGGDPVRADTLRGAGINPSKTTQTVRNNAYFTPTLDGTPPLLAMLLWNQSVNGQAIEIDSSYDAGVIIHEYTHGVSTRLAGTDNSVGLRSNQGNGMGEGWSDFFAMSFLTGSDKPLDGSVATGSYVTQRSRGVRAYPYSTRFDTNPLTFSDIQANTEVHAQGTVWCMMLWEMRQSFIERYGFDAGRQAVERLVINGLKFTPTVPTFIDARDAILLADRTTTGGANQDLIWRAFARRGMGKSASTSLTAARTGYRISATESYEVPPEVSAGALTIDDRPDSPIVIGEQVAIVVVDRDLMAAPSVDVHVRNMRTGTETRLSLTQNPPGRFSRMVSVLPTQADGGPGASIMAQPGDEIVISYANERNESGAFETIETRVVAGRRVTLYSIDFEQEAGDWLLQGYWHLTKRRAASADHSLYFAKKKGANDRRSYTTAGSSGVAYSPGIELQNLVKPQLEFDYYFSGLETPSDLMSLSARNFPFNGSLQAGDEPLLPLTFDARPGAETAFRQMKVDLQYIGRKQAYLSFTFTAPSTNVKRKNLEGFYLDNVRITAVSTQ
jgi:Zn-dependent metalloprotease